MTMTSPTSPPISPLTGQVEIPDHLALEVGRAVIGYALDAVAHYRRLDELHAERAAALEAKGYILVDHDGGGHGECPGKGTCPVVNTITDHRTGAVLARHHDDYAGFVELLEANQWVTYDAAVDSYDDGPVPDDLPSAEALRALPFIQDTGEFVIMTDTDEQMTATEKWFHQA
ncbi:hypothetical protein [Promicromonospora sp. AC04]|uniref:hypothetical protein n=1 Tax=Promicromonospora sp. AC04 TaxID=2135723 RepID=UPI0011B1ED0B|nr:hypothetical protein [Promicromonospora sp. AC04]